MKKILSFIIPILIILFCIAINHFYPFGDKPLLMVDGIKQYPGYLAIFMDILKNGSNLFYSFKGLLGFNLFPTLIYYVFNITNLISIFFSKENILDFYTLVIILKFGLCGLTMNYLLEYFHQNKFNLIFSSCYALTAYNLFYYNNFMWFDSLIYFPIVILGIEKIIKEKKYLLYVIFLALSILSNFYIGYMICLFSLIYFFYRYYNQKEKDKKMIINFFVYSLLTGLLCSFILIPTGLELLNGKAKLFTNYTGNYFKWDLDFINVFYKFSIGSYSNGDLDYGSPNIYVSLFVIYNVFLYFFNKKIAKKEKLSSLIILLFFAISISFNLFDYAWQMMQMPIWYPVRYGFIIDLFLIILAAKNFYNLEIKKKDYIISLSLFIGLMIIGYFTASYFKDSLNVTAKLIYLCISIIFLLYYLFMMQNKNLRKYLYLIIGIELLTNTFITFKNYKNTNSVTEFKTDLTESINTLKKIQDEGFYRMTYAKQTTRNNGMLVGYNDLNYFSSIRNYQTINFLHNYLGIHTTDDCDLTYYYNNPIINALLDLKYYNTKDNLTYYTKLNKDTYLNEDATSLGFMTSENLATLKYSSTIVTNINNLVKVINNDSDDIIEEINFTSKNTSCNENYCITSYDNESNMPYLKYSNMKTTEGFYFINNNYPYTNDYTNYEIKINNKIISNKIDAPFYVKNKNKIEITINPVKDYKDYDYHLYYINYQVYQKFINNIKQNELEIKDFNDNLIKTTIDVKENGMLFTSIPNDKGWTIYVDGIKQNQTIILNSLIGLKLNKGKHDIIFKYTTPGLQTGLIISSLSLIIIIFYNKRHF